MSRVGNNNDSGDDRRSGQSRRAPPEREFSSAIVEILNGCVSPSTATRGERPPAPPPRLLSRSVEEGFESEESAVHARAAFADAIEWFHSQLDRDISDLDLTYIDDDGDEQTAETAREWFREVRGRSDATSHRASRMDISEPHRPARQPHARGLRP